MSLPESATFEISVRTGLDDVVLDLDGEFDMNEVEAFRYRIEGVLASFDGEVILDFADVTFIDSSAIQALLNARKRLADKGRELRLQHFTGSVARILDLAGLADLLGDSTDTGVQPTAD